MPNGMGRNAPPDIEGMETSSSGRAELGGSIALLIKGARNISRLS